VCSVLPLLSLAHAESCWTDKHHTRRTSMSYHPPPPHVSTLTTPHTPLRIILAKFAKKKKTPPRRQRWANAPVPRAALVGGESKCPHARIPSSPSQPPRGGGGGGGGRGHTHTYTRYTSSFQIKLTRRPDARACAKRVNPPLVHHPRPRGILPQRPRGHTRTHPQHNPLLPSHSAVIMPELTAAIPKDDPLANLSKKERDIQKVLRGALPRETLRSVFELSNSTRRRAKLTPCARRAN
jgi:hypothetical protein